MENHFKYPDGTILNVVNRNGNQNSVREVVVETRNTVYGVTINGHFFPWTHFFAVNRIIEEKPDFSI